MSALKVIGRMYASDSHSRTLRILATAALCKVEIEVVPNFSLIKSMSDPAFIAKFPNVAIPAFESSVHPGLYFSQASAICEYICAVAPEANLLPSDTGMLALCRQWMSMADMDIVGALTQINRAHNGMGHFDKAMSEGILTHVDRRFSRLEHYLSDGKSFLVGGRLTLADVTVASALLHAYTKFYPKEKREQSPHIWRYYQSIANIEGIREQFSKAALAEEPIKQFRE